MNQQERKELRDQVNLHYRLTGEDKNECFFAIRGKTLESLLDLVDRYEEALRFYADSDNWGRCPTKGINYREMLDDSDIGDGSFMISETVDDNRVAGKLARKALGGGEEG